jgi:hypothetical protein
MFMRIYLPATLPALARLLLTGEVSQPPVRGFAVTPALREGYSSGDLEELEYIALLHAARASLRLLHDDPDAPRRRVVLAVEVPEELVVGHAGFDEPGPRRDQEGGQAQSRRLRPRRCPGRRHRDSRRGRRPAGRRRWR